MVKVLTVCTSEVCDLKGSLSVTNSIINRPAIRSPVILAVEKNNEILLLSIKTANEIVELASHVLPTMKGGATIVIDKNVQVKENNNNAQVYFFKQPGCCLTLTSRELCHLKWVLQNLLSRARKTPISEMVR